MLDSEYAFCLKSYEMVKIFFASNMRAVLSQAPRVYIRDFQLQNRLKISVF